MKLREAKELWLMMKADEESRLMQQLEIKDKEETQVQQNEQINFLKALADFNAANKK